MLSTHLATGILAHQTVIADGGETSLEIVVSIAVLVITAIALIVTIRQFKRQLQLGFFADYTKRYQEIVLNFPEQINENDFVISQLPPDVREKTMRYMRAYFDLCSEEYFLWRCKHLDDATWAEWEKGISFAFTKSAFREAWATLRKDTIYSGDFSNFVETYISPK